MQPVARAPSDDRVDRLIVQLRAYVDAAAKAGRGRRRAWTSGVSIIFDTETTTDQSQRLRFGAYQIRLGSLLAERGVFYADDLSPEDLATLKATCEAEPPTEHGEGVTVRPLAEFIEEIFFKWGLDAGGLIIGFNLPFDISRIASDHSHSKRRTARENLGASFVGGFSFTLAENRPRVRVKHLSQRSAFTSFAGKHGNDKTPDRGMFVDVKTLAAALTGSSHSLKSLAKILKTTPKSEVEDLGGPLTPEIVRYGMNDVQVTWECFAKLKERYEAYGLGAGLFELYSEASLGKAFLEAMNITPWRQAQKDFQPELIGQIMSAYYGGRAEVHIRREITPVIHCDFLSMYPTVCTLMGLWRFIIAEGMEWRDATDEVREFVAGCALDDLSNQETWRDLTCLVQVRPADDVFPVRAVYEKDQAATIGLNRLTSDEPMWFALPDVLAAKFLGGKPPEIVSAVRFTPKAPQSELRTIALAGTEVRPAQDDFYKLLIDQRRRVQAAEDAAEDPAEKAAQNASQQGLKILANSTSYGIFVEINVQDLDKPKAVTCFDFRGVGRKVQSKKVEEPGRYFHPLLGTLITSAARLMLALAERNALDQGLSWVFCDTDSLAIANPSELPQEEFIRCVEAVRAWFEPLNPYEVKGSILQLEKVNFPPKQHKDPTKLRPVNCLAISAKRYVLFDRTEDGSPVIRKGSAHGLGHLLPPYSEPDDERSARIERIRVELWQEDLWKAIIAAHDAGTPDEVDYAGIPNFDQAAASRYAATNQSLLKWFDRYNETVEPRDQVRPFNFLLSFQAKSVMEMAKVDPDALSSPAWRRRMPHPASRYSRDLIADRPPVFDRDTSEPVPWHWLKTYARALVRHHLHSEMKFLGGYDNERGVLRRRHVHVWAAIPIGKEADNLEEREILGEDGDAIEWPMAGFDRSRISTDIEDLSKAHGISDRTLCARAGVSHHTLAALRRGGRIAAQSFLNLAQAAEQLRHEAEGMAVREDRLRFALARFRDRVGGRNALARLSGYSAPFLGRLISGKRAISPEVMASLRSVGFDAGDVPLHGSSASEAASEPLVRQGETST